MDTPIAIPTALVFLPDALRARIGTRGAITATGRTILEIIDTLDHEFPGLRFNLCHETGELRSSVNIFLNSENIRHLQGLGTPVCAGATIHVLPSLRRHLGE
jgi:sulfur-carrier protein